MYFCVATDKNPFGVQLNNNNNDIHEGARELNSASKVHSSSLYKLVINVIMIVIIVGRYIDNSKLNQPDTI
jgi:hypothetical protein